MHIKMWSRYWCHQHGWFEKKKQGNWQWARTKMAVKWTWEKDDGERVRSLTLNNWQDNPRLKIKNHNVINLM